MRVLLYCTAILVTAALGAVTISVAILGHSVYATPDANNSSSNPGSKKIAKNSAQEVQLANKPIVSAEDAVAAGQPEDESVGQDTVQRDPDPVLPPKGKIPASLLRLGVGDYFSDYAFVVDKSLRTLTIWRKVDDKVQFVEAHAADLGRKPGDKSVLGDLKTPEGIYFFQDMYEGSNLNFSQYGSRAFTMDYPNLFDRLESKTGSGIWLHAVPETKTLRRGSRGCIVVRDHVIKTLSPYITLKKTPIIVLDKVTYLDAETHRSEEARLVKWIEGWRKDWESKNIDSYMKYYSDNFKSMKMDKNLWRRYKESINKKYEYITVRIQRPIIFRHNDEYVVRFLQQYESDQLSDFGEKALYVKAEADGNFRILGEEWQKITNELLAAKFKQTNEPSL